MKNGGKNKSVAFIILVSVSAASKKLLSRFGGSDELQALNAYLLNANFVTVLEHTGIQITLKLTLILTPKKLQF